MRTGGHPAEWKIVPLAQEGSTVIRLTPQDRVHVAHPSLLGLPGGRLVLAFDQEGPGVSHLPGPKAQIFGTQRWVQGRIYLSNDGGHTWIHKGDFPFCHPCLFRDGRTVYLLGHRGTLHIMRSLDGGETWSRAEEIAPREGGGTAFVLGPANAWIDEDRVLLVAMRSPTPSPSTTPPDLRIPVVLRAARGADLTARRAWRVQDVAAPFREWLPPERVAGFGVPQFLPGLQPRGSRGTPERWARPVGWGRAHVVRVTDPRHPWFAESKDVAHVIACAEAHRPHWAVVGRLEGQPDGSWILRPQTTPAGSEERFLPMPGAHLPFALIFDEVGGRFWLVSNQATASAVRPEALEAEREGLPCEERHRVQIWMSPNLVDWQFAGLVTVGKSPRDARHSPAAAIRGDDLVVALCSGDEASRSVRHPHRLTVHVIPNFRDLPG